MENHSLTDEQTFLIKFATMAYGYGALIQHLESYLKGMATNFGINLEMISNGNVVQFVFGDDLAGQRSYFVQLPAANSDMTKIILIENLADSMIAGDISVTAGITRLSEIEKKPARFGPLLNALAEAATEGHHLACLGILVDEVRFGQVAKGLVNEDAGQ